MTINRIVTRGMGVSRGIAGRAGLITQGYGGPLAAVKEAVKRLIKAGQSGTKRALQELQEVIVWAKLIRVNDVAPKVALEGSVKVRVSDVSQIVVKVLERVTARTRKAWEDVKITVTRIR